MVKFRENEEEMNKQDSYLLLEDGTLFKGYSFGANLDTDGEIGELLKLCIISLFSKEDEF